MNQFTDSSMLVEAVLRGQGLGLCRWSLVLDELRSGGLKLAFPKLAAIPTGLAYYVVSPRENLRRPEVTAFRDWVLGEAKSLTPEQPGRA
jgi:LysR family glycine cleavage system transcriptional activator